jgi:peptidoglycan-associated lipoprotein
MYRPNKGAGRQLVRLIYALVFISFGLFGCPKKAPPPVEPPKEEVKKPEEKKPAPPKPVIKPKPPRPVAPPPKEPEKPKRVPQVEFIESDFETIYFDYDKSKLLVDARRKLRNTAELLRKNLSKNVDLKLLIDGHCDERGTNEYNLALGERRAFSARDYLISLGIPANVLYTKSWGEEKPVDFGHNESAWAKNRRAEFRIHKGD